MGKAGGSSVVVVLSLVLFLSLQTLAAADKKLYLIIFRELTASPSALISRVNNDFNILYVFEPIRGIAVQIDEGYVTPLRLLPGALAVMPDALYKLHTTHSRDFLGLGSDGQPTDAWLSAKLREDTIIGNNDSDNTSIITTSLTPSL